jgi:hypothetical protein
MNDPNERPEASPNCNLLLPSDQSIMIHLADGRVEYLLIKTPITLLNLLQQVADDKQTAVTGYRFGARINQPVKLNQSPQRAVPTCSRHPVHPGETL